MTTLTPVARRQTAPPSSTSAMSTIKPILKTKTVLGTRSRSDDDDGAELHSSPIKKRKTVVFNEELNMVKNIGSKTLDDAKLEVRRALEGHARGDDEDYDNLKEVFAPNRRKFRSRANDDDTDDDEDNDPHAAKPQDLFVYVIALSSNVTSLGRSCSGLIKAVLACAWLDRDEAFARAYIQLLAAMSSVQASFFTQVLSMMVDKFTDSSPRGGPQPVPGFPPVDAETRRKRLHLGLKYLLDLYPAGQHMVLKMVAQKFPYTEDSKAVHMEYIDHLLRLKVDKPDLERDIMELILSRLVKLDVEMTLDLENDDDEITRAVLRQLESDSPNAIATNGTGDADGDGDPDDTDAESEVESVMSEDDDDDDDENDEQTKRVLLIKSKLETMDAILDLLFEIYSPVFENPDSPEAIETFHDLLSDFSNVILPHLKSRHTQYLLFNFASKSHQLMDMFIGTLFNLAFESNRPPVVKQAAVAYLASFTARGAKVSSEQVQLVASTFLDYIEHYRNSHKDCRGPDVRKYSQYYAYFQGLLYIFCFRWRELINRDLLPPIVDYEDPVSFMGQDLPWMSGLQSRLRDNISSKLNPLKCCSPVIVEEFARLSHHLRLMYIYPQIERNKSIQLSQFFTGSYATGGALRDTGFEFDNERWTHLEACFPFDPFQLPIAKRWLELESNYVSWRPIAVLERDDDDEESEAEGGGDDRDGGETDLEGETDESEVD